MGFFGFMGGARIGIALTCLKQDPNLLFVLAILRATSSVVASMSRMRTKVLMIMTFTSAARSPFKTLESRRHPARSILMLRSVARRAWGLRLQIATPKS